MLGTNHTLESEELMAWLDGELPADRGGAVAAHLERCPECQRVAADLQRVSRKLMAWQVAASEFRIAPAIAAALEERQPKQWRRFWPWAGAAAGAVVLILALMPRFASHSRLATRPMAFPAALAPGQHFQEAEMAVASSPMIVRRAQLVLTTREFDGTRAALEEILKRHQGYFGELSVSSPAGAGRTLDAALRVPADQLEILMSEIKRLGRVESESRNGEDVTAQYVDLTARLLNARNTEQRLTRLLRERTGKLSDVLAVEVELDRVRAEIERMEAENKNLTHRVQFATVNARIVEAYTAHLEPAPNSVSTRFHNAAIEGYQTMAGTLVAIALFLVSAGPSLLLWGAVLFFPVRAVWRRVRPSQ